MTDPKIIDGSALSRTHTELLREKLAHRSGQLKVVDIVVGDDEPSLMYARLKQKKAEELGIIFEPIHFMGGFSELLGLITEYNEDSSITGMMLQLPLPEDFLNFHTDDEVISLITATKDVDGLKVDGPYMPATVRAVLSILVDARIEIADKNVVVVGARGMVGGRLIQEFDKMGAYTVGLNSQSTDTKEVCLQADVLVSATGVPGLITGDMVKNDVAVIDVGISKVNGKTAGDVDFDSVAPKASKITPVPGGVGPMTVISLMENIADAAA